MQDNAEKQTHFELFVTIIIREHKYSMFEDHIMNIQKSEIIKVHPPNKP